MQSGPRLPRDKIGTYLVPAEKRGPHRSVCHRYMQQINPLAPIFTFNLKIYNNNNTLIVSPTSYLGGIFSRYWIVNGSAKLDFIIENKILSTFPNVEISSLYKLYIEKDNLKTFYYEDIINKFTNMKVRKQFFLTFLNN